MLRGERGLNDPREGACRNPARSRQAQPSSAELREAVAGLLVRANRASLTGVYGRFGEWFLSRVPTRDRAPHDRLTGTTGTPAEKTAVAHD
jgi:hypothetical protein